jgi:hypothetical protein
VTGKGTWLIIGGPQNVNRAFEAIFSYGSSDLTRVHFLQPIRESSVFQFFNDDIEVHSEKSSTQEDI